MGSVRKNKINSILKENRFNKWSLAFNFKKRVKIAEIRVIVKLKKLIIIASTFIANILSIKVIDLKNILKTQIASIRYLEEHNKLKQQITTKIIIILWLQIYKFS